MSGCLSRGSIWCTRHLIVAKGLQIHIYFPFPNIRSALKISLAEAEWHIYVCKLTIFDSDIGLSPSHYLNHCWNIANSTLGNRLQWNFSRNSNIFIQENAFENGVCEMASILSRSQCVNHCHSMLCAVRCVLICILDLHKLSLQYDPYIPFTPYIVLQLNRSFQSRYV